MKYYTFLIFGMLLTACSNEPEPIVYGSDSCSYCKMTIVSKAHSAQMVTKKGKQFKYDAIECMMKENLQNDEASEIARMLVADYRNPGSMIPAHEAIFVMDEKITSPMGENLAAIKKNSDREEFSKILTWNELKEEFLIKNNGYPQSLK